MVIVSCPECSKRLKVADTSVGKKVKCSCGKVFVAETEDAAHRPPSPPGRGVGGEGGSAAAPEKVLVACSECGAKLKVATTSLGKKMKCPKCAGVFTASAEEEAPASPPAKKATKPPPKLAESEEDAPEARAKAAGEDDMEDLFSFAQKDAEQDSEKENRPQDGEEEVRPKAKAKPGKKADPDDEEGEDDAPKVKRKAGKQADLDDAFEDDDAPAPKSKLGQKGAKPPRSGDDDDADKKPVYPRRTVLNLIVFLLLIAYIAFFALVFLDIVNLGFPRHKGPVVKGKPFVPNKDTEEEKKKKEPEVAPENKKEAAKLEGTWTVDSARANRKALDDWKGKKVIFSDDKATVPFSTGGSFKVDASKAPKWIDITTLEGLTVLAIYKLDGDEMQLCTNTTKVLKDGNEVWQAGERPTQFDSKQGMLVVLKREKKKDG
jgi:uncharacterized protein (TIGR03067 family)